MILIIIITISAAALLVVPAFYLGYVWGWNDRGIHNRMRRAQLENASRRHENWAAPLIESHRQEAEADAEWAKILHQWASEGPTEANVTKITLRLNDTWPSLPSPPDPSVTGPQDVIA